MAVRIIKDGGEGRGKNEASIRVGLEVWRVDIVKLTMNLEFAH